MRIGGYRVQTVLTSAFRLDGGAMFGSVPKVLWEKERPADEKNRIELATRSLWLEEAERPDSGRPASLQPAAARPRRILVDAGNGDKFDAKGVEMFRIEVRPIASWGVPVEGLTDVILTHLHFDHAGGMVRRDPGGALALNFPQAAVHLQKANWENARAPWDREKASYMKENIEPLAAAKLNLLDGGREVLPGIRASVANGHTRGLQWLLVGEGRGAIAFPADLIPTASHLHLPWIMGYDRCAETTFEEKRAFLRRAVEERWVVVFEHDPRIAAATVKVDDRGRFVLDEVVDF